jgi:protein-S-isoprenylcysteine O-methyltransferase Ste14
VEEFDPFGLLEKYLPARIIHLFIRISIIAVLSVFLIHCISSYDLYRVKPLWFMETLIFIAFLVSYLIRKDPVNRSSGTKEIIVPLIGGILPFALLISPPNLFIAGNPLALQVIFYWMTAATALTVWGLWTLRRSFSITVEARDLVISGPYRWIRHPIYSGEILTALAISVWRFSLLNLFIITLFVVIQMLRAKWEENKLALVFPGYSIYAAKTSWLFPHNKQ